MSKDQDTKSKVAMQAENKPDQKKDQSSQDTQKRDNNNFDKKRSTEEHGTTPKEYTKSNQQDQKSQGL